MRRKPLVQAVFTAATGLSKLARVVLLSALALHPMAYGQKQKTEDGEAKLLDLEEIIVTGTPGGAGVRKLDASFAITSLNKEDITKFAPKSTADLFKTVPGVWTESSGGVSGANIQVRGLPAPSDAPFVTVSINNSPVYGTPSLSFLENSTLFRVDETVARFEALRGGPNPVFSSGQPGLTTNFILKEGGDETEGLIKYTTSDYDLNRVDAVLSGKLSAGLYYMIGGYVTRSPGIRDAQFTSDKGEQYTINITKDFSQGHINFYSRSTNDTGGFYTAIPLDDEQEDFPGFDAGTGTYIGNDLRFADIAINANGDMRTYDLADGRGVDIIINGFNARFDLDNGWTVRDNLNIMSGNSDAVMLFDGDVKTAAEWAAEDGAGFQSAAEVTSGRVVAADDVLVEVGFWVVDKELSSFTNDLSFSRTLADSHEITLGMYTASYSADDFWSLGNNFYVTATDNSKRVDIIDSTGTALSVNGRNQGSFFSIRQKGDTDTRAFYLADSWMINNQFTLDAGIRYESVDLEFAIDQDDGVVVMPDGLTSNVPDGNIDRTKSISESDTSYTVGVNWAVSDSMGAFARINQGHLFPTFESSRNAGDAEPQIQDVDQYEIGYKLATDYLGLFATLFYNEYDTTIQRILSDGTIAVDAVESETTGLEVDAEWDSGRGLVVNMNATILDGEYKKSDDPLQVGNQPARLPDWQVRISPSYEWALGNTNTLVLYGAITAIDKRFSDPENEQEIDGFEKVDLGAIWYVEKSLSFQLAVDNVTDEVGLTEGSPRTIGAQTGVLKGRPIFGRSARFSVGYNF